MLTCAITWHFEVENDRYIDPPIFDLLNILVCLSKTLYQIYLGKVKTLNFIEICSTDFSCISNIFANNFHALLCNFFLVKFLLS